MRLKHLLAAAALVVGPGSFILAPPAAAQTAAETAAETPFRPVAVVNDSAITGFDLTQRELILRALDSPAPSAAALRQHALDQLIDDRLKLQEAERSGITVTAEMTNAVVDALARRAGTEPAAFRARLGAQGISEMALDDMARAHAAWLAVIGTRFTDSASGATVNGAGTAAMPAATTEFDLLELGLAFGDDGRSEAETRALAERLSASLAAGGDFEEAVARYSASPSASDGGHVGWVGIDRMPANLAGILRTLDVGDVSEPLPVTGGLSIVKVIDKRTASGTAGTAPAAGNGASSAESQRLAEGLLQDLREDALIDVR